MEELFYHENLLNDLIRKKQDLDRKYDTLSEEYIKCDKIICDIMHYIEISKFNTPEGYFSIKDLQKNLKRRRDISNEKAYTQILLNFFNGKEDIITTKNNYTNKVLKKHKENVRLFQENKILKIDDLNAHKVSLELPEDKNSYILNLIQLLDNLENKRKELITSLAENDKTISNILKKIENDNFGLIQGYSYAKKIKELRIERRKVKNELELFTKYMQTFPQKELSKLNESVLEISKIQQRREYTPRIIKSLGSSLK